MLWIAIFAVFLNFFLHSFVRRLISKMSKKSIPEWQRVLLLVFKDPILGLAAGVQLSANKMLSVGDWLEMPKYGADGNVMDIALTTVKVQNWDNTITTVPTYALISESFKNWRGMSESGGRRIKRSILLETNSIRFLDNETFQTLKQAELLGTSGHPPGDDTDCPPVGSNQRRSAN